MMSIFKPHLDNMQAYQPPLEGRSPDTNLLLDFNERTLPVSDSICQALIDYIQIGHLHAYPSYGDIIEKIAGYCCVPVEQVMITNGSDQGIELVFRAACTAGDEVIIPAPSFAMYEQCANVENVSVITPYYDRLKGFPFDDVLQAINSRTRLIVIPNPNNPTGTAVPENMIIRVANAAPHAVILVDECYFEYTRLTVSDYLEQCSNLVITRTFSKTWGLPSVRMGYLLSHQRNIETLLKVRGPYDVNQFAVVAVSAALEQPGYTERFVDEVMTASKPLLEAFLKRRNVAFWPASANFIWIFPAAAKTVLEGLRERNILVRPKSDNAGRLGLRITVGSKEQTLILIEALEALEALL